MDLKTWRRHKKFRLRINKMIESCQNDATEQLAMVREMIENADSSDIKDLALIALANENAAKTLHRMHQLSYRENANGMAQSLT